MTAGGSSSDGSRASITNAHAAAASSLDCEVGAHPPAPAGEDGTGATEEPGLSLPRAAPPLTQPEPPEEAVEGQRSPLLRRAQSQASATSAAGTASRSSSTSRSPLMETSASDAPVYAGETSLFDGALPSETQLSAQGAAARSPGGHMPASSEHATSQPRNAHPVSEAGPTFTQSGPVPDPTSPPLVPPDSDEPNGHSVSDAYDLDPGEASGTARDIDPMPARIPDPGSEPGPRAASVSAPVPKLRLGHMSRGALGVTFREASEGGAADLYTEGGGNDHGIGPHAHDDDADSDPPSAYESPCITAENSAGGLSYSPRQPSASAMATEALLLWQQRGPLMVTGKGVGGGGHADDGGGEGSARPASRPEAVSRGESRGSVGPSRTSKKELLRKVHSLKPPQRGGLASAGLRSIQHKWRRMANVVAGIARANWLVAADRHEFVCENTTALIQAQTGMLDVALEVDSARDLESINYAKQGNSDMYTRGMLDARRSLRNHPMVQEAAKTWWRWLPKCATRVVVVNGTDTDDVFTTTVDEPIYSAMVVILTLVLLPRFGLPADINYDPKEDWLDDNKGLPYMDWPNFFDALFELADMWAEGVGGPEYADLLKFLLHGVQELERKKGVFTKLLMKFGAKPVIGFPFVFGKPIPTASNTAARAAKRGRERRTSTTNDGDGDAGASGSSANGKGGGASGTPSKGSGGGGGGGAAGAGKTAGSGAATKVGGVANSNAAKYAGASAGGVSGPSGGAPRASPPARRPMPSQTNKDDGGDAAQGSTSPARAGRAKPEPRHAPRVNPPPPPAVPQSPQSPPPQDQTLSGWSSSAPPASPGPPPASPPAGQPRRLPPVTPPWTPGEHRGTEEVDGNGIKSVLVPSTGPRTAVQLPEYDMADYSGVESTLGAYLRQALPAAPSPRTVQPVNHSPNRPNRSNDRHSSTGMPDSDRPSRTRQPRPAQPRESDASVRGGSGGPPYTAPAASGGDGELSSSVSVVHIGLGDVPNAMLWHQGPTGSSVQPSPAKAAGGANGWQLGDGWLQQGSSGAGGAGSSPAAGGHAVMTFTSQPALHSGPPGAEKSAGFGGNGGRAAGGPGSGALSGGSSSWQIGDGYLQQGNGGRDGGMVAALSWLASTTPAGQPGSVLAPSIAAAAGVRRSPSFGSGLRAGTAVVAAAANTTAPQSADSSGGVQMGAPGSLYAEYMDGVLVRHALRSQTATYSAPSPAPGPSGDGVGVGVGVGGVSYSTFSPPLMGPGPPLSVLGTSHSAPLTAASAAGGGFNPRAHSSHAAAGHLPNHRLANNINHFPMPPGFQNLIQGPDKAQRQQQQQQLAGGGGGGGASSFMPSTANHHPPGSVLWQQQQAHLHQLQLQLQYQYQQQVHAVAGAASRAAARDSSPLRYRVSQSAGDPRGVVGSGGRGTGTGSGSGSGGFSANNSSTYVAAAFHNSGLLNGAVYGNGLYSGAQPPSSGSQVAVLAGEASESLVPGTWSPRQPQAVMAASLQSLPAQQQLLHFAYGNGEADRRALPYISAVQVATMGGTGGSGGSGQSGFGPLPLLSEPSEQQLYDQPSWASLPVGMSYSGMPSYGATATTPRASRGLPPGLVIPFNGSAFGGPASASGGPRSPGGKGASSSGGGGAPTAAAVPQGVLPASLASLAAAAAAHLPTINGQATPLTAAGGGPWSIVDDSHGVPHSPGGSPPRTGNAHHLIHTPNGLHNGGYGQALPLNNAQAAGAVPRGSASVPIPNRFVWTAGGGGAGGCGGTGDGSAVASSADASGNIMMYASAGGAIGALVGTSAVPRMPHAISGSAANGGAGSGTAGAPAAGAGAAAPGAAAAGGVSTAGGGGTVLLPYLSFEYHTANGVANGTNASAGGGGAVGARGANGVPVGSGGAGGVGASGKPLEIVATRRDIVQASRAQVLSMAQALLAQQQQAKQQQQQQQRHQQPPGSTGAVAGGPGGHGGGASGASNNNNSGSSARLESLRPVDGGAKRAQCGGSFLAYMQLGGRSPSPGGGVPLAPSPPPVTPLARGSPSPEASSSVPWTLPGPFPAPTANGSSAGIGKTPLSR